MTKLITVYHINRSNFPRIRTTDDALRAWREGLYRMVATVECDGREQAYMLTQNITHDWQRNDGVTAEPGPMRSTSVGDIIDVPGEGYLLCKTIGWEPIDIQVDRVAS